MREHIMSIRRIKYVFAHDIAHNERVHLVEALGRVNATMEHMQCYQNNMASPKEDMHSLLKMLKLPSIFNEKDCRMIINKLRAAASKDEITYPVATLLERHYFSLALNANEK